ncbi:MAG TPA: hypothetical protein VJU59_31285 [Paraburkholderia sp.]|jgi:hypothetical protein|uniref:hypothetical protein n=1 Tax=Paraburkholderia sp. TaxID=1926495 RepID=UPI002B4940B8|nr:hypothetical protein [Paraburkholderia sp.]HKR44110.1 hypothetical protein [Paraburkholderia sp.]
MRTVVIASRDISAGARKCIAGCEDAGALQGAASLAWSNALTLAQLEDRRRKRRVTRVGMTREGLPWDVYQAPGNTDLDQARKSVFQT